MTAITLEDFFRENPGNNKVNFTELKALSDEMYLRKDRSDNAQSRKIVSIHSLEETGLCAVSSPEDSYIGAEKKAEQLKKVKKFLASD